MECLTRNSMSRCIIDYLSVSGCPAELQQIKAIAKVGGLLKSEVEESMSFPELESKVQLAQMLDGIQLTSDNGMSFNECYNAIVDKSGIAFLDSICRGDVFTIVEKLNKMDAIPGANRWSIEETGRGMFGYQNSANILCDGAMAGKAAWGAKNFGYLVSFSGEGCSALDMKKTHDAMKAMPGAKITRVDIAFDDFEGRFDINASRKLAKAGKFNINNRAPKYMYIEGGQLVKAANGSYKMDKSGGCSFYVGSRTSGKMYRHYEKGAQLGDKKCPNWTRAEVELRSKDRVLPFDILLEPDKYLAASYPCLAFVAKETKQIKTFKRKYKVAINKAFDTAAKQVGRLVNFAVNHWDMSADELVLKLIGDLGKNDLPERLILPVPVDDGPSQIVETLAGIKHWDCPTEVVERLLKDNFDNRPNDRGIQPCLS